MPPFPCLRPAGADEKADKRHATWQATSIRSIKSLVPLLDRVLVQRVKAESKTASGLFLPESSVKELNEGRVLAVGPGAVDKDGKRLPMGVANGDRVLIPQVSVMCLLPWVLSRGTLVGEEERKSLGSGKGGAGEKFAVQGDCD